ncbi:hypothetical protein KOI35_09695 [Actinoplanes bogorensis]|uniref:Fe2OG dioxygenase domain-containing protein n=1 Tax=Paractinoplanes bogorensis TaxID=1610840 RepID=A0ABS5YP53_9ACTN|nr:2-oxoglutarate and iron-dependent oxygenase domain-containing protein [Actinoplanes bogorensis]MBU2663780.1 hypothetical protein [Actinoplanes bogorensis]
MTQLEIPVVDISRDPLTVGREIDETLRTVGFFQIVEHGVDPDVMDRCWKLTRAFFDLPDADKLEIERQTGSSYGYFPIATESLAQSLGGMGAGDLKESLNALASPALRHTPVDDVERELFTPPRWPSALPGLKGAWGAYGREMNVLAERLMSIFALGLGLDATFFADKIDQAPQALRAINYPEQAAPPADGQLRAGAHTDYGTLTILRQEMGRGGLEVHDSRTDSWIPVPAVDGAFVINIGDLMAQWTNDRWTSTLHRVVNPDAGSTVSTRRQSMPFFHNANYSQLVECLPTCLGSGARYEPVLAGPHLSGKSRKSVVTA